MELAQGRGGGGWPPRFLGQTNAVFTADRPTHPQHPAEELVEDAVHLGVIVACTHGSHQVDVNVAIPGVTKAGDVS